MLTLVALLHPTSMSQHHHVAHKVSIFHRYILILLIFYRYIHINFNFIFYISLINKGGVAVVDQIVHWEPKPGNAAHPVGVLVDIRVFIYYFLKNILNFEFF